MKLKAANDIKFKLYVLASQWRRTKQSIDWNQGASGMKGNVLSVLDSELGQLTNEVINLEKVLGNERVRRARQASEYHSSRTSVAKYMDSIC